MTIKLSELKAARAAMTPGPYAAAEANRDGFEFLEIRNSTREVVAMPDDEMADENAAGIVATHNAADVLIEIVELDKHIEDREDTQRRIAMQMEAIKASPMGELEAAQLRSCERRSSTRSADIATLKEQRRAALAKVML